MAKKKRKEQIKKQNSARVAAYTRIKDGYTRFLWMGAASEPEPRVLEAPIPPFGRKW